MPRNAVSARACSGINVLILWAAIVGGYGAQRWLTYRQAATAGGHVRRGEKGTVVCYANRFTPKDEAKKAQGEDRYARTIAFLKRFTVFNGARTLVATALAVVIVGIRTDRLPPNGLPLGGKPDRVAAAMRSNLDHLPPASSASWSVWCRSSSRNSKTPSRSPATNGRRRAASSR
jgi:hypothetical protein